MNRFLENLTKEKFRRVIIISCFNVICFDNSEGASVFLESSKLEICKSVARALSRYIELINGGYKFLGRVSCMFPQNIGDSKYSGERNYVVRYIQGDTVK